MNWQIIIGAFFMIGGLGNLTRDFGAFLFGLVVGGGLLFWGLRKKGFIKKTTPIKKDRSLKVETFRIAGSHYYTENINKLANTNPSWNLSSKQLISDGKVNKRVFRYHYTNTPVELIPEPDNAHDNNAIMVQVAGEKVGYISREENLHVKELLDSHEIKYISCFIGGGPFKYADESGDLIHDELSLSVDVKIGYV